MNIEDYPTTKFPTLRRRIKFYTDRFKEDLQKVLYKKKTEERKG